MNELRTLAEEMMDTSPSNHEKIRDVVFLYSLPSSAENISVLFMNSKFVNKYGDFIISDLPELYKGVLNDCKTIEDFSVFCKMRGIKLRWDKPFIQKMYGIDLS